MLMALFWAFTTAISLLILFLILGITLLYSIVLSSLLILAVQVGLVKSLPQAKWTNSISFFSSNLLIPKATNSSLVFGHNSYILLGFEPLILFFFLHKEHL